jgi:flavin-dependent dehydrogenase
MAYLVRRELLDRELAKLALMAGVKLFLNVMVNELIKEDMKSVA